MRRLNYGLISLIPKIKEASNIRQFRPICLPNVSYKIITKVLTHRLALVAAKVISDSQTAFVPGRYIIEGVVILHEIVHELQKNNEKGVILKLDFEKAYDKVQWSFFRRNDNKQKVPSKMDWMD